MDHLFHPWHWVPVLAAAPFIGVVVSAARAYIKQRMNQHVAAED
jgi:hypothetical protein